ncbi:GNAT family protein [Ottowia sp.]|uniref:GNAT family N-acetyltransferase n=1 Tax=Ottowia sp. TaxID=1898956 RepID=UPI00261DA4D3|nr:GNAT family protein [Ottowia sp.]
MQLVPISQDGSVDAPSRLSGYVIAQVVDATVDLYNRRGFSPPWTGYLAVENRRCVGSCGFAGPPHAGEVELAYFTFPGNEGRGVASRMAGALIAICQPEAARNGLAFTAHTLPADGPSPTILRKLGFAFLGAIEHPEDGTVWKWHRPSVA